MIHRYADLETPLGTLFNVSNAIWNGTDHADSGDLWYVPIGAPAGTGTGACVQVTSEPPALFGAGQSFWEWPIPSPSRSRLLARHRDDAGDDRSLWVMNADGTGRLMVNAQRTEHPEWLGEDALAFFETALTTIRRVNVDGTGETAIVTKDNFHSFNVSPDGTRIAYVANVGANTVLGIVDADGSNDTTLVASGVASNRCVWTLDGALIMFPAGTGMDTIKPDGSNRTTIITTMPNGFWYPCGMADDRFFYTNTTDFSNWRPAYIELGGGGSTILSPNRRLSQAVQRAVCVWDPEQGRMFSVLHKLATGSTGVDAIFSVLPDGSDFRIHFEALEEDWSAPGENFQNLFFR